MSLDRAAVAAAVRDLDLAALAGRRWFASKGEPVSSARLAHAFALSLDHAFALVDLRVGEGSGHVERYAMAFVSDPAAPSGAREAGETDGAWRALATAIAHAHTISALPRDGGSTRAEAGSGQAEAALVCRPATGFADVWGLPPGSATAVELREAEERPLGRDQSNTSVVIGGRMLLKAYRRIESGLNPDLELTAYLSEEAAFPGVPRLAGWAEVVTRESGMATVAMLQEFVAHADDAYETTAEQLAALVAAPGVVSLEWATELAADLGTLVAGLHAALAAPPADAPDLAPRLATHDELKSWRFEAHRRLNVAITAVAGIDAPLAAELRQAGAQIAARASRFEAAASSPGVMRIHGDLHLGQILVADDGYWVIDFEGDPLRPLEERRRLDSPLRDVASLLRSLDHVARSGARRAERRVGGPIEEPGLDIEAWIERSRARLLGAYAEELRRSGAPLALDLDLLDAFEVAKECSEFVYAATVLPNWLWAPRDGMRWLLAHGEG